VSLKIDIDRVKSVLLVDGWHEVADGSFWVEEYEFDPVGGGQLTGAIWKEATGTWIASPLTALLAVRLDAPPG